MHRSVIEENGSREEALARKLGKRKRKKGMCMLKGKVCEQREVHKKALGRGDVMLVKGD